MSYSHYSHKSLLNMPNCLGLNDNGSCSRLNVSLCMGEECTFRYTKETEAASNRKAVERLLKLDDATQERIARKYYRGKRLWQDR